MLCDLHTHSVFSDGTYTPAALIDSAIERGLSAIALTDHNTVDGLPDFISAARGKSIDVALGAEFSVDHNEKELHLLGLFIPEKHFDTVSAFMESANLRKEESNIALIDSLGRAGYPLDYEKIKGTVPNGRINRAHIAAAMVQKGYISSVKEGFDTLLSKTAGHYKEPKRPTLDETLDFISTIGAVSVLAHPFLQLDEAELVSLLHSTEKLCGIECYYSAYDEGTTRTSLRIANEFGLLPSGGSDFHGATKPDIQLGVGKGSLQVPYAWYCALRERAR